MEENEDKGFKVNDRRKISLDEKEEKNGYESAADTAAREEASAKARFEEASRGAEERGRVPLPEVTLSTFIFSLSSSALVHLGEIPEPDTQNVHMDLPMAKQIIDTLGMLQDKTRGNLEPDEDRLLKTVLYDLRMRYVQKSGK
ncbi:MAG: DUF1844 domain-containing protein [Syntrophobacteraceae bacterium]|nr:DUF1844 domain-containing protein [Desulfobacteraceae bacterium]